jgi:ketosteroid isomerase-like protein
VDRYIAFWRREDAGWRIAAYAETYGSPPGAMSLPAAARGGVLPDVPMPRERGWLEGVRAADVEFSKQATALGTGEAFGRFAAEDAQVFSAPGEFISGPDAIRRTFAPAASGNSLVWHPIAGEVSKAGDLGFTVGNAVFTGHREDGGAQVGYSKYLTVWRKQRDGSWRYVVDGGSARPLEP